MSAKEDMHITACHPIHHICSLISIIDTQHMSAKGDEDAHHCRSFHSRLVTITNLYILSQFQNTTHFYFSSEASMIHWWKPLAR